MARLGLSRGAAVASQNVLEWDGGQSGTWVNGGSGWKDKFANLTVNYSNATTPVTSFPDPYANNAVTVSGSVTVKEVQVGNSVNLALSGGQINGDKPSWNVGASSTATVASALTGTNGIVKTGPGTLVLSGANTYTGVTEIAQGSIDLNGGSIGGNVAGAVIQNNSNLVFRTDLVNTVNGTGSLTKAGAGEAYLWSPNSYTEATLVTAGTLTLGGSGAISSSSTLQISAGAAVNLTGSFAPNNINRTFSGLSGDGVLYGGGGTVTLQIPTNVTSTFNGDIQGPQGVIKTGQGILALTKTNNYTGNTDVNGGTLLLSGVAFTQNLNINGAFLRVAPSSPGAIAGNLNFTGNARIRVIETIPEGQAATLLMSVVGNVTGTATLLPASGSTALAGYTLMYTGNRIWARANGTSSLGVVNGNFLNTTRISQKFPGTPEWYGGIPVGWQSNAPGGQIGYYDVRVDGAINGVPTVMFANMGSLSGTSQASSFRQKLGTMDVNSSVTLTFGLKSLNGASSTLNYGLFNQANDSALANSQTVTSQTTSQTITLTASNVTAGTQVYLAFWTPDNSPAGISNVQINSVAV